MANKTLKGIGVVIAFWCALTIGFCTIAVLIQLIAWIFQMIPGWWWGVAFGLFVFFLISRMVYCAVTEKTE